MRMKKIMILAVTAFALAACAKTYEVKESTPPPIGFGAWTETLTKARTQGESTWTDGDKFTVYGYKTNGAGTEVTVFNGVEVTCDDASATPSVWSYTDTRFWDKNFANYYFYGISKDASDAITYATAWNAQAGTCVSNNVTFTGKNYDILVAKEKNVASASYGSPVEMDFTHIASMFDVKFRKAHALANAEVKITAITLSGIKTTGAFSVTGYASTIPSVTWTANSPATVADGVTAYTAGVTDCSAGFNTDIADWGAVEAPSAAGTPLVGHYIAMPQGLGDGDSDPRITFTYTIKVGDETTTYTDNVINFSKFDKHDSNADGGDNTTNGSPDSFITSWEQGKHYTYYVTIGANAIQFTASITPWTTVNGYNYLIN